MVFGKRDSLDRGSAASLKKPSCHACLSVAAQNIRSKSRQLDGKVVFKNAVDVIEIAVNSHRSHEAR